MKYGFVIDNRKCIGCHACTTACKSEHDVPVGVNRTWVKQVEKGEFPDTRRLFSVMRCNHCTDAPCVSICPTESLYIREDGIVDFDKERCIGCKSCMQACPYDALYIDPDTHTAAKCNYCAHRIDIGLEPACVNVCPEQAIISGDMDDPESEIAELLAKQAVKVRKPEKGTQPNLFYIDADDISLVPGATPTSDVSLWGSQSLGVGHFAKEAEKLAFTNDDVISEILKGRNSINNSQAQVKSPKSVEVLMNKNGRRVYDTPNKGILWGWEVSAYVWTKAIAAGVVLVPIIVLLISQSQLTDKIIWTSVLTGLFFLSLTGIFLVLDLDQPKRFLYVLLRPHFGSWLVKGGYTITLYGGILALLGVAQWFQWYDWKMILFWAAVPVAILLAVYTAFLFAQAKGRDFWQSPVLSIHMIVHSVMAGTAVFLLLTSAIDLNIEWSLALNKILMVSIGVNLFTMLIELTTTHPTEDAQRTVKMIVSGRYSRLFWIGVLLIGNLLPLALLSAPGFGNLLSMGASVFILLGIYLTEHIWIEAPQRISLI